MYTWEGMKRVNTREAKDLFIMGTEVFILHDDNTESLVECFSEINDQHEYGIEIE